MARILLDPGHGKGYNPGAVTGYCEGTAMYEYAAKYLLLQLATAGHTVSLTRSSVNADPNLTTRGKGAKAYDLFLSLHSNAGGKDSGGKGSGVSVYYSVARPHDLPFGQAIGKALADCMGIRLRGVVTRPSDTRPGRDYFTVIDMAAQSGCPHVLLIEHGFHDNPNECAWLMQEANLRKMAQAECAVICQVLGGNAAPVPSPQPTPVPSPDSIYQPTLHRGDKGEAVREMQRLLMAKGYRLPNYGADGDFGEETETALLAFIAARNLATCDAQVWAALTT